MEILFFALILGIIPAMIARSKGYSFFRWYVYGAALFIIALVHSIILKDKSITSNQPTPDTHMICPECKEFVRIGAIKCRHCGCEFATDEPKKTNQSAPKAQENTTNKTRISFSYTDAGGEHSHRVVDVDRVYERNGIVYIDGFCRTREDSRTFRPDRIVGDIYIPFSAELMSPETYCLRHGVNPGYEDDSTREQPYQPPKQYWSSSRYVPINAHLKIGHQNENGEKITKNVLITTYNGSSWIEGFCESSQNGQMFRVEEITSCIDTETGEIVTDLPQHLLEKYHSSPGYILEQGMDKLSDILAVLYYVGKADGQLRAEERKILRAVVRKVAVHDQITDDMIDRQINGRQVPSLQAVKLAINRICKADAHNMAITYKIAQRIVATQKTVHPSETEISEYMRLKMEKEGIEGPIPGT